MNIDWKKINNFGRTPKRKQEGSVAADSAETIVDEVDEMEERARAERAQWGLRQQWTTRAIRAAIIAALIAGIASLLLVVFGSSSTPAIVKATENGAQNIDTAAQAQAEDVARQLVVAWLQGSRGNEREIERFVATPPNLPASALYVATDPAIASIAFDRDARTYAVTVSVSVRPAADTSATTVRRYFQVPVVVTESGARAATLPSEVAQPSTAVDVKLGYKFRVANHPIGTSANQFLSALLTGNGEVARYLTPGVSIAPIVPAPYRSIALTDVLSSVDLSASNSAAPRSDGDVVRLLITASLKITDSESVNGQYALTMTSRGGRWEVSAIDSTPLFATAPRREADSSPTSAPSTSTPKSTPSTSASTSGVPTQAPAPSQTPGSTLPAVGEVPLFSPSGN
ncbi:conjugal transfer protein [Rhodococcus sp. 5A-K4]|uniref:conjugal transfer protein n=1 Tax=Rhodococcus TaxID=1827 RepID=UPI000E4E0F30|nr:conjugal transfer protein [Rhodococcus sp. WY5]RGP48608.1 hypothetical protein AWH04_25955 [Rhodococcus erythropolis]